MEKTLADTNWKFKSSGHDSDGPKVVPQGKTATNAVVTAVLSPRPSQGSGVPQAPQKTVQELPHFNNNAAFASKAQVVGWPPIRSFRKNTLATSSKNTYPLFVKVSMDGAPYLRKVDLRTYTTYQESFCGLEKMFSCFTLAEIPPPLPMKILFSIIWL